MESEDNLTSTEVVRANFNQAISLKLSALLHFKLWKQPQAEEDWRKDSQVIVLLSIPKLWTLCGT